MLARAYAEWLLDHEPTDQTRAALIAGLFRSAAKRLALESSTAPRLLELAGPSSPWPLSVSAEALLAAWLDADQEADSTSNFALSARLAAAHALGEALDILHAVESAGRKSGEETWRRKAGSYFTPRAVAASLVAESLATPLLAERRHADGDGSDAPLLVCDPAMGGGAFLIEAIAGLVRREQARGIQPEAALERIGRGVFGFDQSRLAVATAEAALSLVTGRSDFGARIRIEDSLLPDAPMPEHGFDWLIGNPPWVAFQGRAAQKLEPERRAWLRRTFAAFAGYPTLHGVFAERATTLAPHGLIALLLPSSLSDLDGYRAARSAVVRTHTAHEPLLEYGQDAFSGVVQPCFGLLASPRVGPPEADPGRPWRLRERSRHEMASSAQEVPVALVELQSLPTLPSACFGELGLQSNRRVSSELFLRGPTAVAPFVVPLLEGRNVRAFQIDEPRLFMNPDPAVLADTRCRFRPIADYGRVGFVVRQTAAITIAARHNGLRFRNSLLAGYADGPFDVELLLGLLNSTLFRAFHASRQRDARQATFPQVKVAHLRSLPAPPTAPHERARVRELCARFCQEGPSRDGQTLLDDAVFDLYGLTATARAEVTHFLSRRFSG